MRLMGIPIKNRSLALHPNDYEALINSEKLLNNFNAPMNKSITEEARLTSGMARYGNFDYFQSNFIKQHTVGLWAGSTPLVNGANQSGTSLITDGWVNSTQVLNKGDRFRIAGVYSVNPASLLSTGRLAQFIVTADVTSNGSGQATIPFSLGSEGEGISLFSTTNAYQNVVSAPADNAAITILGASGSKYNVNYAYCDQAFTLACVKLAKITAVNGGAVKTDTKSKLSFRMTPSWDALAGQELWRFEHLFGTKAYGKYGVAIVSKADY
jgi:hypothetical protein